MSSYQITNSSSSESIEKLDKMKGNVRGWFEYFRENNQRFHQTKRSVCNTSITAPQMETLRNLGKPPIEFEEREAYVNKQCGEFRKHTPGFEVRAASNVQEEDLTPDLIQACEVIESHGRYLISEEKTGSMDVKVFRDQLLGGYSVISVFPEYIDEMSFEDEQELNIQREPFPTKCFFDITATQSHKGDGDFCGRIYAYKEDKAKQLFGEDITEDMNFTMSLGNFSWSYQSCKENFIVIAEYYEKQNKQIEIVKLSDGKKMTMKEYKKLVKKFEMIDTLEIAPIIVNKRITTVETICCYKFSGTKILEEYETDYKFLPLVFVDGSSEMMEATDGGDMHQMTRPYVYHLQGIQQLKNIAGQAIAAEMENMIAHKFMAPIESLDPQYLDPWRAPQIPGVLLYKAWMENQEKPNPSPQPIPRQDIPAIVPETFSTASRTMQEILGNYDQLMGMSRYGEVSGRAIMQSAIQTAEGVTPYLQGYIDALNRIGQILIDLIPKYYKTPRTIPVIKQDGQKGYQVINPKMPRGGAVYMNYDPLKLNICIKAGVNSEMQKQMALDQIIKLCQASPVFAQFINEQGLEVILDNLDIRNIDLLKMSAREFMQKVKQQQANQPQINPLILKQQELQLKAQENQANNALEMEKIKKDNREVDIKEAELIIKAHASQEDSNAQKSKANAENIRSLVEISKHIEDNKDKHLSRIERGLIHNDKMSVEHRKIENTNQMR